MTREQLEQLQKRFDPALVKTRTGSHGKNLDYLEGATVVDRLNMVFDGGWSFTVESHEILQDEVIVLGKLSAGTVTKHAFGGSRITRNKETGEAVCLSDDLKSAATDSIKKASTLMGCGLYLYSQEERGSDKAEQGQNQAPSSSPKAGSLLGARISNKQHKFALNLARDVGLSKKELNEHCRTTYGVLFDFISRTDASSLIEALKNNDVSTGQDNAA